MSLRIACPGCSAALTVSERGAGHVVACPKCRGRMVIPAAPSAVEEPAPQVIDFAEPAPPPRRPAPSSPSREIVERTFIEEDDDDEPRPRRRRNRPSERKRAKSPGPAIVLAVGIVLTIAAGAGVVWLATRMAGNLRPVARDEAKADADVPGGPTGEESKPEQADRPNDPPPNPTPTESPANDDPLPAGWSYNSPSLGFKAAWPIEKGPDGFAPNATLHAGKNGVFGGDAWALPLGSFEAGHLGVSSMVLPDVAIESEQTLDNYVAKITRRVPSATVKRVTVFGRTGREITHTERGMTVIHRATIVNNVIWTAQAVYGAGQAATAKRFLDSFRAI